MQSDLVPSGIRCSPRPRRGGRSARPGLGTSQRQIRRGQRQSGSGQDERPGCCSAPDRSSVLRRVFAPGPLSESRDSDPTLHSEAGGPLSLILSLRLPGRVSTRKFSRVRYFRDFAIASRSSGRRETPHSGRDEHAGRIRSESRRELRVAGAATMQAWPPLIGELNQTWRPRDHVGVV